MPSKKIKVAAAQILTGQDISQNLAKIRVMIRQAHKEGCRIVLFHEGCLNGYQANNPGQFPTLRKAERQIRSLAKRLKIAVLLGSLSKEAGKIYNDILIIDETGLVLGRYAKTWRAGETKMAAGAGPVIFRVAGVDATVIICHDLRYPEMVRLAVAAGAKIVFIANNESGLDWEFKLLGYRSMQISRATESAVYAVMCNAPANPNDIASNHSSHGNSKIVDPRGRIIDEAGWFEERLVIGQIDPRQANRNIVLRTMGRLPQTKKLYGVACENPQYAEWIKFGVDKLVRRLDGTTCLR